MKKALWGLLVVAGAVGVYAGTVLATPQSSVMTTTYAKSSLDSLDLHAQAEPANLWRARLRTHGISDFYVVDNKFSPGGTSGWHSHPGPSLIFVVAGEITNYRGDDRTCTPHVYTKGQAFVDEGGRDVHMLRNNGAVDAETIAVQFVQQGATRRIDKPDPGYCHFGAELTGEGVEDLGVDRRVLRLHPQAPHEVAEENADLLGPLARRGEVEVAEPLLAAFAAARRSR